MENLCIYEVAYPEIAHPLILEKQLLKEKYVKLLGYYLNLYLDGTNKEKGLYRLETLSKILLNKSVVEVLAFDEKGYRESFSSVNRTRFTPFRLFSYRYLFLFDALFVLGIDNQDLGSRLCEEILKMTNKRYHDSLKEMVSKMYENDSTFAEKHIVSKERVSSWINARNYLSSGEKKITFTATMSAGKSTLINALIGRELSYSKKAACTSTIMKFLTSPCKTSLFSVATGNEGISFMSEQEVREFTNQIKDPCEIMGYFDSVLSAKRIALVDTPGVNSSLNPEHKRITREELRSGTDILVYVIPVESYGSEDDYNHLRYIKKYVPYKKVLFVVNMMDSCDFEDDTTEEIVYNIKKHLSDIGFEDPIVCPMSAKAGILLKKAISGMELNENDKKACKAFVAQFNEDNLQLGMYYPQVEATVKVNDDSLWKAFVATGLPGFESLLYQYIREGQ